MRYAAMFVFLASKTVLIEIKKLTGDRFTSVETQDDLSQGGTNWHNFCGCR